MENASKALTMAAGVLIAVLIIVLIYVLLNNLSDLSKQDEQQLQAKQTAAFNKEYESYDKKLMRGTELITLINKAIANNEKYDNEHEIYDVNIVFTLKSDVTEIEITVKYNKQIGKEKKTVVFEGNKQVELKSKKAENRINPDLEKFMQLGVHESAGAYQIVYAKKPDGEEDLKSYTKTYNAYTVFKRKIFKCVKIGYSDETGRVNYMEYEEQDTSNLDGYN